MPSNVASTTAEIYQALFADIPPSSEVYAVDLSEEPTEALIDTLADLTDPPTVRLLTSKGILRWLRRDFHTASTAADLRAAGTLSLRSTDDTVGNSRVVTETSVVSLVTTDDRVAGLETHDTEFVETIREQSSELWENAELFDLRTPPQSRVYETMADELGDDIETDYRTILHAVESTRSSRYNETEDDILDEVELCILVGAKHEILHYDLSRWAEDVGLASKATFSRTKNRLEEKGLLTIEKVPIDVGRPRQRLLLDDRLRDVSARDLPSAVQDTLASAPA